MAQKSTEQTKRQNGLPVSIHPDDAKDKVFTAILKALLKMGNKPSSPKELANIIVKHKYATLGGATPFATVSSRISQHFKRAAEHNPPRAPLLAKHIDQNHSRKINYSLATESVSPTTVPEEDNNLTDHIHPDENDNMDLKKKCLSEASISPPILTNGSESEGEQSDYHEEMLQGIEINEKKEETAEEMTEPVRKPSFSFNTGFLGEQELWTPCSFEQDFDSYLQDNNIPFNIATPESISVSELDDYFGASVPVRPHRKSLSSAMPNDKSLLQKVLLASAARGVEKNEEDKKEEKVFSGDDYVKFEEDDKKDTPLPQPILPAPAKTTLSTAELLKSLNIQNLNLSAIHQMTTTPQPNFDLVKTMAAYMQTISNASSSGNDIKNILARLHLEPLLKKESPPSESVPNLISVNSNEPIVNTLTPMQPPMYITIIDHIAVCIAILEKTDTSPEYRIMRRVDTGFINGTILLTAGGIETESERSMILSFEMERIRMPKKKSPLFGTWIPLRRAQELAVTCSIQHKLGSFLEDSLEAYFPSPLPIHTRKPNNRISALALASLRGDGGFVVPPISRPTSSSGSMAAAQLQELLLNHPHRALKSNGVDRRFDSVEEKEALDEEPKDVKADHLMSDTFKRPLLHIHPRDLQKKRRRSSLGDEPIEEPKVSSRKKMAPTSPTTGGKWSGGKFTASAIRKSASFAGSTTTKRAPSVKKTTITPIIPRKSSKQQEETNVVVEHSALLHAESPSTVTTEKHEDDEDEDIDIGGSDFDDDLR